MKHGYFIQLFHWKKEEIVKRHGRGMVLLRMTFVTKFETSFESRIFPLSILQRSPSPNLQSCLVDPLSWQLVPFVAPVASPE